MKVNNTKAPMRLMIQGIAIFFIKLRQCQFVIEPRRQIS